MDEKYLLRRGNQPRNDDQGRRRMRMEKGMRRRQRGGDHVNEMSLLHRGQRHPNGKLLQNGHFHKKLRNLLIWMMLKWWNCKMGRKLLKLKLKRRRASRMEMNADSIPPTMTTPVALTLQTKTLISTSQCETPVTKHPYPSNHTAPSILLPPPPQSTKNTKSPSQLPRPPSVPLPKTVALKLPPRPSKHPHPTTKLDNIKHDREVQVGNDE
jgi:hypothetical protein